MLTSVITNKQREHVTADAAFPLHTEICDIVEGPPTSSLIVSTGTGWLCHAGFGTMLLVTPDGVVLGSLFRREVTQWMLSSVLKAQGS
jgi:hypothetical protein